jgi:hypothetical protein
MPSLPVELSCGLSPETPLARSLIRWRHRSGKIEQLTQRNEPLGRRARAIDLDLPTDAPLKGGDASKHA